MPFALPATKSMASLGAWVLRSDTELLLKSRRVVPGRLLDAGFDFSFAAWPEASADLVARVTASRARGSSRTAAGSAT
jgi:NAD dependent epimerase/dehydratase family enzyme